MKKTKFTEAQIVFALCQAGTGVAVAKVCRNARSFSGSRDHFGVDVLASFEQTRDHRFAARSPAPLVAHPPWPKVAFGQLNSSRQLDRYAAFGLQTAAQPQVDSVDLVHT